MFAKKEIINCKDYGKIICENNNCEECENSYYDRLAEDHVIEEGYNKFIAK